MIVRPRYVSLPAARSIESAYATPRTRRRALDGLVTTKDVSIGAAGMCRARRCTSMVGGVVRCGESTAEVRPPCRATVGRSAMAPAIPARRRTDVCHSLGMAPTPGAPGAADLLRSLGLSVDGPARWGSLPDRADARHLRGRDDPAERAAPRPTSSRSGAGSSACETLRLDGERPTPTALDRRLCEFWVPGQRLLYVGRSEKSLGARVKALYATELGHRRPHAGGHWLKTLREPSSLVIWWAETDAGEEYEDALLSAFARPSPRRSVTSLRHPEPLLPWANLDSPSGARRETGLTGSLLANDTEPAQDAGADGRASDAQAGRPAASRGLACRRSSRRARVPVARRAAGGTGRARRPRRT